MDDARFDALARRLASRRAVLAGLGAVLVPGSTAAKHKPKKKCKHGTRRCRGQCLSVLICCDDADCAGGRTCQDGTCACPAAKPHLCPGSTVCKQCCVHTDCNVVSSGPNNLDGFPYCGADGACACPTSAGAARYCPTLQFCGACCGDAECANGRVCSHNQNPVLHCNCPDVCLQANLCGAGCNPEDSDVCQCGGGVTVACAPRQHDGYFCGG